MLRLVLLGWSEPAAPNAPVADEPVEAVFRMNENPILPACIYIFFPPPLYPKIFPPPTYHLPTPPAPHSIARASETSSGSELGAGAEAVGARACSRSLELRCVVTVAFFSFLLATEETKTRRQRCRRFLLPLVELRCSTAQRRRR